MKIALTDGVLNVSEIDELATGNASSFHSELTAALPDGVREIEIDMSRTDFVDCRGLGALIALRNRARTTKGDVPIRLLNPPQPLQRMVSLMHMDGHFAIEEQLVSLAE